MRYVPMLILIFEPVKMHVFAYSKAYYELPLGMLIPYCPIQNLSMAVGLRIVAMATYYPVFPSKARVPGVAR